VNGLERVLQVRRWTDETGVEWVRRGEALDPKRARRLILDPTARVLVFGMPSVVDVPAADRADYWERISPYVLGSVHRTVGEKTADHFDCELAEFRDADRRVLVAVYESC
jgi:hypothetical protein